MDGEFGESLIDGRRERFEPRKGSGVRAMMRTLSAYFP